MFKYFQKYILFYIMIFYISIDFENTDLKQLKFGGQGGTHVKFLEIQNIKTIDIK